MATSRPAPKVLMKKEINLSAAKILSSTIAQSIAEIIFEPIACYKLSSSKAYGKAKQKGRKRKYPHPLRNARKKLQCESRATIVHIRACA